MSLNQPKIEKRGGQPKLWRGQSMGRLAGHASSSHICPANLIITITILIIHVIITIIITKIIIIMIIIIIKIIIIIIVIIVFPAACSQLLDLMDTGDLHQVQQWCLVEDSWGVACN